MNAVKLSREDAAKRSRVYGAFNTVFRAGVPAALAIVILGAFKSDNAVLPEWLAFIPDSWEAAALSAYVFLGNLSFGVFAAIGIFALEARDSIRKRTEELKLQSKTVYAKNRAVTLILLGVFVAIIYLFATKAMIFFFGSGFSNMIAWYCETKQNEMKMIVNGVASNV